MSRDTYAVFGVIAAIVAIVAFGLGQFSVTTSKTTQPAPTVTAAPTGQNALVEAVAKAEANKTPATPLLALKKIFADIKTKNPGAVVTVTLDDNNPAWMYIYAEEARKQARWTFEVESLTDANAYGSSHDASGESGPLKQPRYAHGHNGLDDLPTPVLQILHMEHRSARECWTAIEKSLQEWIANPR